MKLFNQLVLGHSNFVGSAVASLESADFELPEEHDEFNEADLAEQQVALEQLTSDYNTIMSRVASLEELRETLEAGDVTTPEQALLVEQIADNAVEGTDLDANDDVVPGLESILDGKAIRVSTEGITETISKLLAAAKKASMQVIAQLGKILGSVRAKGYLVKEDLKKIIDDVKANGIDTSVASVELRNLASTLTADNNVPNDAAELVKFLNDTIKFANAALVKTRDAEGKAYPTVRKTISTLIEEKGEARKQAIALSAVLSTLVAAMSKELIGTEYRDKTTFSLPTTRGSIIGGENAIISNFIAVDKDVKDLIKTDSNAVLFHTAFRQLRASLKQVRKPDSAFKKSVVKPFTAAEFSKVADKILELVNVIEAVYTWPEEFEKENERMWTVYLDAMNKLPKDNTRKDVRQYWESMFNVIGIYYPFYRTASVRTMDVAHTATKLLKKMANEQILSKKVSDAS